eukprot:Gb_41625 [translate_table: standard]
MKHSKELSNARGSIELCCEAERAAWSGINGTAVPALKHFNAAVDLPHSQMQVVQSPTGCANVHRCFSKMQKKNNTYASDRAQNERFYSDLCDVGCSDQCKINSKHADNQRMDVESS